MRNCIIYGAGGYGQVLSQYLREDGDYVPLAFIDDDERKWGQQCQNLPVDPPSAMTNLLERHQDLACFAPIGNNAQRQQVIHHARQLGFSVPSYIHSKALVSFASVVGEASYVLPNAVVMPFVQIGEACILSVGANVAHHTTLGSGSFFSTGTNVGASINIGDRAFVGIGATIMTGVKHVGNDSVLGAGAVVIRDVPANTTVAGVPAKPLR